MINQMQLFVFNPELTRIGILDNYISCTWEEYYQDIGKIYLVATDTEHNNRLLRQGNLLFRPGKGTAMCIAYVKYDSRSKQIIVHGYSTLHYLTRRTIEGTITVHNAEQGMLDIVNNNLRGLPNIVIIPPMGLTEVYDTQYTGGGVMEAIIKIAAETDLGFTMFFDYHSKLHRFRVYKGLLRVSPPATGQFLPPAIFSEEFGNLANMTVTDDMSVYKNVAYVAGAGEGEARKIIIVGEAEGLERFELWVDARDIQPDEESGETVDSPSYIQRLTTRGIDRLNERIRVQTFNAEVEPRDFEEKYSLGDLITCKSARYGIHLNTRIMHYKEVIEDNKTRLTLTLGNPEITFQKGLILR